MKTHIAGPIRLGLVSALAINAGLSVAQAQDSTADEDGAKRLGAITVTAQRREQNLIDVPLSVTAFDSEQLELTGAVDITSIQRTTPNATIEVARGSNSTLIAFIRGVGQQDPLWGFEPGVGLYVDDVYVARPQGAILDIFDIDRIEVLRGPQGTLYGRNTIGGAIKYVTKPLSNEPELKAKVNVGSYGQLDGILSGSTPIGDTLAIGGAIAKYTRDGYGKNLNTGAEHYNKDVLAYRLSADWTPTDDFSVRFAYDRSEDDSNAKHGHRLLPSADGTIPVTGDVYDTRAGIGDKNSVTTEGYSLTAQWDLNDAVTLKSITAYREGETETPIDFDALPQNDFDVPAVYYDDQFSQEFQLLLDSGPLSGVMGVYYLDGNANGAFDVILGGLGLTVYQGGDQSKENISLYGDFTYALNDQWSVSLGGRYTEDKTTADVTRELWLGAGSGSFDPTNASIFFATQTSYSGVSRDDNQFTPRLSVSYKPTDNLNLYATYAQGFKAGGFDPRAREDLDPTGLSEQGFGPETVDSYEIGLKGVFFDNRLTLNSAIFLADYKDQQITVQSGADSDNDGVNDTFVSSVFNAGESQYTGFELEGAVLLTDQFTLSGNLGYIDAEIQEILSGGINVADQFVTQNTPELQGQVALNYTNSLGANRGYISLTGSVSYRDEYYLFNVANPGFPAGQSAIFPNGGPALDPQSYSLLDLSAVWTSPTGKYRVGLHGRNLTDEEYRVAAYNFVTPSQLGVDSAYSAFYGPPRTITASLSVEF
ncbi:MAG: TonB-dependent receptor [Alphaproteobacteria bacterium]|nr:TonB-dependent receptor [Alphaproteobacteria bacterium]MBU2085188.1 TonB-dependent receptor [Alphaproteobacteria bacterium]MBU2142118.1 TonB-dependent receptor [Alphaproteobacteria bacterium]MBU2197010.1 TonB-dependent receptor [Alphaproteobacteria bacterium]